MGGTPALALAIDLTPFVQPGPAIATRVTLSFHFVREPWWPRDLTDALADLADSWLQRLEDQAHATALCHLTHRTRPDFYQPAPTAARARPARTSLSAASADLAHRQVFET